MHQSESDNYISSADDETPQVIVKRRKSIAGPVKGGLVDDDEIREESLILQLKQYEASAKEKDREIEKLKNKLSEAKTPYAIWSPVSPDIAWICETLEHMYLKQGFQKAPGEENQIEGITPTEVSKYIDQAGRASDEVKFFVQWLTSVIKKSLKDLLDLWMGYEIPHGELVFVAIADKFEDTFPKQVMNFKIIQRIRGQISDEGKFIASKEIKQGLLFGTEEQISVRKCLAKHSSKLMKAHSNLTIVSASKIKSVKHGRKCASYNETLCVTLYVSIKGIVPIHEEPFPENLDDIPIDVREGCFKQFGKDPAAYHKHLMMGCQIVTAYNTCGTLGAFLQLGNDNLACLTCGHVFENEQSIEDYKKDPWNHSFLKKDVYQPFPVSEYKIGQLKKFIKDDGDDQNIGVDAALIEITNDQRFPRSGYFPNAESHLAGFSPETPMHFNSGDVIKCLDEVPIPCSVVKYGASTGHTIGTLRLFGPAVLSHTTSFHLDDRVRLHQQFEVVSSVNGQPFAEAGDSGALVFYLPDIKSGMEIRALGLLVGGTDYDTSIVTPLWAVLNKFNLPLQLLAFDPGPFVGPNLPSLVRLEGVEKDVVELKGSVSKLVENAVNTEVKMNLMDQKIDEIGSQTQRTEQNIQQKLDLQHAELIRLLTNKQN